MINLVSGKISRKTVKNGPYGDKVSFLVNGNWLSCFAADKKLSDEAKEMLRELQEGDEAEFSIVENQGKDGKTYLNITGAVRVSRIDSVPVTQVREEGVTPPTNRVAPGVYQDPPPSTRTDTPGHPKEIGDTRTRSMCVAYSKDLVVAGKVELGKLKAIAEELYQYVMTGE